MSGFSLEREQPVPELRCTARIFSHVKTGARLIHLLNDDPNNLFCCAFRTPASDSTGVPHILEHSVLGGSRKYPFKDPFQQLLKSSLQTFLNALTYPDKTVYPVGSQVAKDFYNLVDVYCDAVFHPLLSRNTFYQEGWHFDAPVAAGPVSIKGIVYNEMKGVFSEFASHVGRRSLAALFPDAGYRHESGGDPQHITDLTWEQFRAFHARFYHPSNAFIYLYGNLPTEATLAFLDQRYLAEYERLTVDSTVPLQPAWSSPRRVEFDAPSPPEDEGFATVNLCWLLAETRDPLAALAGSVLSHYLLGAESSPLRRALIDSGLGQDLDDMSGFEQDLGQTMFTAGLRKSTAQRAGAVEKLVLDTLARQADGGIDADLLEGCLRQAEFGLREIADNGRYPYSLKLADRVYRSWMYGGDPLAHLRFEATLAAIRTSQNSPTAFFTRLIRGSLLENPHRLTVVVKASPAMGRELADLTERQAARLTAGFSPQDVARCHEVTQQLLVEQKRQVTAEDLAALPRLSRSDLPAEGRATPTEQTAVGGSRLLVHPIFCGGIVYLDIGFDCGGLPADLLAWLPLYAELATRCGAAGLSYEQMATRVSLATGGIDASVVLDESATAGAGPLFRLFFHGKCLASRVGDMAAIFADLFTAPRLDEPKLVSDIVLEMRNEFESSLISQGHSIASLHAAGRLTGLRACAERLDGVEQLRFLHRLSKQKDGGKAVEALRGLHGLLVRQAGAVVSLTADDPQACRPALSALLSALPRAPEAAGATFPAPSGSRATGIEVSSSVNFVAKAWSLGSQSARDLGLLSVLSANLSRGYLWDRVRVEGGAYGAFASIGSTYPVFTCASYRDPNVGRTLVAFEEGLRFGACQLDDAATEESVIATIGQIDKPRMPHSRGFGESLSLLLGRSPQYRQELREAVLTASAAPVRRSAQQILDTADTAVTVLGSAEALSAAQGGGLALAREPLLGPGAA